MENKLKQLFDYQRFENDPRLAAMISETFEKYGSSEAGELPDDEAEMINAAGSVVKDLENKKRDRK